ncbi:MAG: rRNA synthase [Solirubrobacteraceae bacterium]|jgi:23S rRNA pseudouridine1911/1915/1917 synthase|nr:rRNA synthase [Solirubrobacteraceae bacterium]
MTDVAPGAASRIQVPAEAAGTRLDQFLAGPLGSRARAQRLIDEGRVRVDGGMRRKSYELQAGEVIGVEDSEPRGEAPAVDISFGVPYEDEHLIVVDKPAGVVVHPARGHRSGTLSQALAGRAAGGDEPWRAGIVHRLDRDTSGLLVVAKRDDVHRALKALLAARELGREYLALVAGTPSARSGTIEAAIGRDRRYRTLMSIDSDEPREARTNFEIVEVFPAASLLRVSLDTGRTHQIRVHLQSIGHPVCGDRQYGVSDVYGLERQFLHAARLAFPHPVTGEAIDVSSRLPGDLTLALTLAARG